MNFVVRNGRLLQQVAISGGDGPRLGYIDRGAYVPRPVSPVMAQLARSGRLVKVQYWRDGAWRLFDMPPVADAQDVFHECCSLRPGCHVRIVRPIGGVA